MGKALPGWLSCTQPGLKVIKLFSSPGGSPGRAIVLPPGIGIGVGIDVVGSSVCVSKKFNVKVFYVMGKALSGELSCPCDRSCFILNSVEHEILNAHKYKISRN